MLLKHILFLVLITPFVSFSQNDILQKIDSLVLVDDMPYICHSNLNPDNEYIIGCGSNKFWEVVKLKENAIPYLINKLNDTLITVATVPNFGYYYTVADIAFVALSEILHGIPTFQLLGVEFDDKGCGYCSYWQHLNEKYINRLNFQIEVQKWYLSNKDLMVWIESNNFSSCDCNFSHPNNGHFELPE